MDEAGGCQGLPRDAGGEEGPRRGYSVQGRGKTPGGRGVGQGRGRRHDGQGKTKPRETRDQRGQDGG